MNRSCGSADCENPICKNCESFEDLFEENKKKMAKISTRIKISMDEIFATTLKFNDVLKIASSNNATEVNSKMEELSAIYNNLNNAAIILKKYHVEEKKVEKIKPLLTKRKGSPVRSPRQDKRQKKSLILLSESDIEEELLDSRRYFKTYDGEPVYFAGWNKRSEACRDGRLCRDFECRLSHSCCLGSRCVKKSCNLYHPEDREYCITSCGFRNKCSRGASCKFYHGDLYI